MACAAATGHHHILKLPHFMEHITLQVTEPALTVKRKELLYGVMIAAFDMCQGQ